MELLSEMIDDPEKTLTQVRQELGEIGKKLRSMASKLGLMENVTEDSSGNTVDFVSAVKRFTAARKALGIVNKLPPGENKAKHVSRIMGNMNKLRALVARLEKQMGGEGLNENALIAKKASDMIVRDKKVVPFCCQEVLRKMGFRRHSKRTEELAKVEDGNLYKGCTAFVKKDDGTYYVNDKGWIMASGERKFYHPLLHPTIREFLHSQSALDFIPIEGGKILVDPRPSILQGMGIKCSTT